MCLEMIATRATAASTIFFLRHGLLILSSVFNGLSHSYYPAGVFKAPLPDLLVHIHGAVFSRWILLLTVQGFARRRGRVDLHRRLATALIHQDHPPQRIRAMAGEPLQEISSWDRL